MTLSLILGLVASARLVLLMVMEGCRGAGSSGHAHLQPLFVFPPNTPLAKGCHVGVPNLKSRDPPGKVKGQRAKVQGKMKNFLTQIKEKYRFDILSNTRRKRSLQVTKGKRPIKGRAIHASSVLAQVLLHYLCLERLMLHCG